MEIEVNFNYLLNVSSMLNLHGIEVISAMHSTVVALNRSFNNSSGDWWGLGHPSDAVNFREPWPNPCINAVGCLWRSVMVVALVNVCWSDVQFTHTHTYA